MSPNEHYREAERYLVKWQDYNELDTAAKVAAEYPRADGAHAVAALLQAGIAQAANLLAAAQVHATLATLGERQES